MLREKGDLNYLRRSKNRWYYELGLAKNTGVCPLQEDIPKSMGTDVCIGLGNTKTKSSVCLRNLSQGATQYLTWIQEFVENMKIMMLPWRF